MARQNFLNYSNLALNVLFLVWSYQMFSTLWIAFENKSCYVGFASDMEIISKSKTAIMHQCQWSCPTFLFPKEFSAWFNICRVLWRQKEGWDSVTDACSVQIQRGAHVPGKLPTPVLGSISLILTECSRFAVFCQNSKDQQRTSYSACFSNSEAEQWHIRLSFNIFK